MHSTKKSWSEVSSSTLKPRFTLTKGGRFWLLWLHNAWKDLSQDLKQYQKAIDLWYFPLTFMLSKRASVMWASRVRGARPTLAVPFHLLSTDIKYSSSYCDSTSSCSSLPPFPFHRFTVSNFLQFIFHHVMHTLFSPVLYLASQPWGVLSLQEYCFKQSHTRTDLGTFLFRGIAFWTLNSLLERMSFSDTPRVKRSHFAAYLANFNVEYLMS